MKISLTKSQQRCLRELLYEEYMPAGGPPTDHGLFISALANRYPEESFKFQSCRITPDTVIQLAPRALGACHKLPGSKNKARGLAQYEMYLRNHDSLDLVVTSAAGLCK